MGRAGVILACAKQGPHGERSGANYKAKRVVEWQLSGRFLPGSGKTLSDAGLGPGILHCIHQHRTVGRSRVFWRILSPELPASATRPGQGTGRHIERKSLETSKDHKAAAGLPADATTVLVTVAGFMVAIPFPQTHTHAPTHTHIFVPGGSQQSVTLADGWMDG